MIYRHTQEQVNKYYEDFGLNQSSIKEILANGIESYLSKREELQKEEAEKKHFIIGDGVDTLLTMGMDVFNSKFHVSAITKKPGDKTMAVIKEVYSVLSSTKRADDIGILGNYPKEIYNACNNTEFYMNRRKATYQEDNRISEILKDNAETYWDDLITAQGKQVLSIDELTTINIVATSFQTHKHTAHLLKDNGDSDIIFQLPIYYMYKGIRVKVLIDAIKIMHSRKVILPIDFKTSRDYILKFNKVVKGFRYDIQGSFYTSAIISNMSELEKITGIDLSEYTVSNLAFAVESTVRPGVPLVFPLSDSLISCGRSGDGRYLLGWEQGIDIYTSWLDKGFSIEKMFEENNGVVWLDNNFEYNKIF